MCMGKKLWERYCGVLYNLKDEQTGLLEVSPRQVNTLTSECDGESVCMRFLGGHLDGLLSFLLSPSFLPSFLVAKMN